jgi:ligand-binding SRPBCC domain-containing protein
MYTLEREQIVHTSLDEAWIFLRDPGNLNKITPDDLDFQIVSPVPEVMFNGLLIEYKITIPFFGGQQWIAEIKHIREFHSFVDEQRIGPYTFWYHYHELNEVENGVRLIDRVYYDVPWSFAGRQLHRMIIRKTLGRIFDYRSEKLSNIFNG